MPLYEYHCTSCGKHLEVLQHVGSAPPEQCPSCGGALEKLASAPAIRFKGSGFYVNDYGRSGTAKEESAKSDSGPNKDTSTSAPAAKTEPTPTAASPTKT